MDDPIKTDSELVPDERVALTTSEKASLGLAAGAGILFVLAVAVAIFAGRRSPDVRSFAIGTGIVAMGIMAASLVIEWLWKRD